MIAMQPFFRLVGRASVFWLSAIGIAVLSAIVIGMAEPDARARLGVDPVFVAAFVFPAAAGWLAGGLVQEFQHTTFAASLPGVRPRVGSGFVIFGVAVVAVVVGAIAMSGASPRALVAIVGLAIGAYGLGGILNDPLSIWITSANVAVVLAALYGSAGIARLADRHPVPTAIAFAAVGVAGFARLFARSTFRRRPFRPAMPFPGRFAVEKSQAYQRRRTVRGGPREAVWTAGAPGSDAWRWVRAAFHEVHGSRGLKATLMAIPKGWGIFLIFGASAWLDRGDLGFGEALARSVHDALLRSPHVPPFGERGGPIMLVALAIPTVAVLIALFAPVALGTGIAYPLSRRMRAVVSFRGGLVDAAFLLGVVGTGLLALGQLAGWLAGYDVRFDFMPFFFRVLLVTVVVLPFAHWGRLGLQAASWRRAANSQVTVIFSIIAFDIAVIVGAFVSAALFRDAAVELAVLAVAVMVSQAIHRSLLIDHYATADLA